MIGTKVKVGWDAASVQRGMKGLIGTIGKGFGAIGRGGLERIGHRMTDTLGRIIAAAPEAIKDLADYGGELSDLSAALEIPVDRLVQLQEAMRLGGAGVDSLRMFAMMAKNIELANADGEDLAESLHKIGLRTDEMAALKPDKQFEAIAAAIQKSELPVGQLIDVLSDIFGGRVGMKMLNLFRGFDATMARAAKNSGGFAKYMAKAANGLDEMSDALDRWEMFRRGLASVVVGAFTDAFGTSGVDAMFDRLDPSGLREWFSRAFGKAIKFVQDEIELMQFIGLENYLRQIIDKAGKAFVGWLVDGMNAVAQEVDIITDNIRGKGFGIGEEAGRGIVSGIKGISLSGFFQSEMMVALSGLAGSLVSLFGTAVVELGKMAGGAAAGAFMEGVGIPRGPAGMSTWDILKSGIKAGAGKVAESALFLSMTQEQATQLIALTKSIDRKFGGLATV